MRVLILTSCTGDKRYKPGNRLTEADFRLLHTEAFTLREQALCAYRLPARDMYTGQQHARLLQGLESMRRACPELPIDLKILSAGYSLLDEEAPIVPYEMTFQGMKASKIRDWAEFLQIPQRVVPLFDQYDLSFVLLGREYLRAIRFPEILNMRGACIFLASEGSRRFIPQGEKIVVVSLGNKEAKRLGAGLVALKGRVLELLGERVIREGVSCLDQLRKDPQEMVRLIGEFSSSDVPSRTSRVSTPIRANATTEASPPPEMPACGSNGGPVIQIPKSWWDRTHRSKMMYFIPEWDDLVNPRYDFQTDSHPDGTGDGYEHAVYAHQMYDEPQYDGILISKVVVENNKRKKAILENLGVHRYLRVPREFPIMGDCGAFGYIDEEVPPYETSEILDYYQNLDFDYGVSIDHLIVNGVLMKTHHYLVSKEKGRIEISEEEYDRLAKSGQGREVKTFNGQQNFLDPRPLLCKNEVLDEMEQWRRYQLTVGNAREFIEKHRKGGYQFTPIGAAQGWSPESYASCVREYQKMGYRYIALGGLVRTNTKGILEVLEAVHRVLKLDTRLHLFGVARPDGLLDMMRLGVKSIDSATFLRKAWLGADSNYFTPQARYAAIRIPQSDKSPRAKKIIQEGKSSLEAIQAIEAKCLGLLRTYDQGQADINTVLEAVMQYDDLIGENRRGFEDLFRKTLEDKPWKQCSCKICREVGIEVIIFRGNNRNRRRGFHNTCVFYDQFCRLAGSKHEL